MLGFKNKKSIENEMSEWLAHPHEFGIQPKSVRFKRTYKVNLVSYGTMKIHLVNYEMPNGILGRGFVNGNLTWSFLGSDINLLNDDDLLTAYCGWAWLFPALQSDAVITDFESEGELERFMEKKKKEGFQAIKIGDRFKIGTSELFEYKSTKQGIEFNGAGDSNIDISFQTGDPKSNLPAIYFLLGEQVIKSVK